MAKVFDGDGSPVHPIENSTPPAVAAEDLSNPLTLLDLFARDLAGDLDRAARRLSQREHGISRELVIEDLARAQASLERYRDCLGYLGDRQAAATELFTELVTAAERCVHDLEALLQRFPAPSDSSRRHKK